MNKHIHYLLCLLKVVETSQEKHQNIKYMPITNYKINLCFVKKGVFYSALANNNGLWNSFYIHNYVL